MFRAHFSVCRTSLYRVFTKCPNFGGWAHLATLADFWVQGAGQEQFFKIEGGIDLTPESPERCPNNV